MLTSFDPRTALCQAITNLHRKGWAPGTGGNFSQVIAREPLRLLMSPSGVDKGTVQAADLIEVDAEGTVLMGDGRTSAEAPLHVLVATMAGAGAVLHTHSVNSTLLSEYYLPQGQILFSGYEMLKGLAGIGTHDTQVAIPILANDQDMTRLCQQVRPLLDTVPRPHGFLLAGHGLYTWGKTLFEAQRHLEILEFLMELTYHKLILKAGLPTLSAAPFVTR